MGQLFVRSSLFRSGALVSAGVMDAGYHGAIGLLLSWCMVYMNINEYFCLGGLLQVINPHGLTLYQDAKLAQFVFHTLAEKVHALLLMLHLGRISYKCLQVTGYSGVYQNKSAM